MLDLYDASILDLQAGLKAGEFTSVQLIKAYIARIAEVNDEVRAVICTNDHALEAAAAADKTRTADSPLLHGIPILLKDNICTTHEDGMDTTAGSLVFKGVKVDDAYIVKLLKNQGAIILGKLNLSEWAYFRDHDCLPSGWSPVGGQTTCPYYKDGQTVGSSSGSGVAATLALAAGTLGSETNGSIICPSSRNNCVGLRPTVGLVSRSGIIPITAEHDSAGPMTANVTDAAILLDAIFGKDASDKHTSLQPEQKQSYVSCLDKNGLKGRKLAYPKNYMRKWGTDWEHPAKEAQYLPQAREKEAFNKALDKLRELGAEVVEIDIDDCAVLDEDDDTANFAMQSECKTHMSDFLATLANPPAKDLAGIIELAKAIPEEVPPTYEGMKGLEDSAATGGTGTEEYTAAKAKIDKAKEVIDACMKKHGIDAFVHPTYTEGWSRAGYPEITVPLGFGPDDLEPVQLQDHPAHQTYYNFPGQPFGITFGGTAWSEGLLISIAYAFEQATHHRKERKPYKEAMPTAQIVTSE